MNIFEILDSVQNQMLKQKVDTQEMTLRCDGAIQVIELIRNEVYKEDVREQPDPVETTPSEEPTPSTRRRAKKVATKKS